MSRKTIRVLISILHICLFAIGIVLIYFSTDSRASTKEINIELAEEKVTVTEAETQIICETELQTETMTEEPCTQPVSEPASELTTEFVPETSTQPVETETIHSEPEAELSGETVYYTFEHTNGTRGVNIRKSPSLSSAILGSVPLGGTGNILLFENEDWAYVEYKGVVGYCHMDWITVIEHKETEIK